jgi:hypothetical protein
LRLDARFKGGVPCGLAGVADSIQHARGERSPPRV